VVPLVPPVALASLGSLAIQPAHLHALWTNEGRVMIQPPRFQHNVARATRRTLVAILDALSASGWETIHLAICAPADDEHGEEWDIVSRRRVDRGSEQEG